MANDIRQFIESELAKGTPKAKIYDLLAQRTQAEGNEMIKSQRGFAGELLPTAGAIGGGIIGGIAGAYAGGAGAVPGAIAGAGIGGAGGEAIQQKIEKTFSGRQTLNPGQIAATGVTSAVLEATGIGAAKVLGTAAKALRPSIIKTFSYLSGYADEVVTRALQRTSGAVEGTKLGEVALSNIVTRSAKKIQELASTTLKEGRAVVAKLDKLHSLGGVGREGSRNKILSEGNKFVYNTIQKLRETYKIGIEKGDKLLFSRENVPSNIASVGDQNTIQEAFKWVNSVRNNTSIKHIDAIFERLITLKTKTPGGGPTGPETKKIIGDMMGYLKTFVEETYPEYSKFLADNLPKRVLIGEAKELIGDTANLSAKEIAQAEKRLLQLFNSGNLPLRKGAEELGAKIGEDLVGGSAGTLIKAGDEISVRAKNLTTRGIFEKLGEYFPRQFVQNYIKTGKISGELLNHPITKFLTTVNKATLQEIVNLMEDKTKN